MKILIAGQIPSLGTVGDSLNESFAHVHQFAQGQGMAGEPRRRRHLEEHEISRPKILAVAGCHPDSVCPAQVAQAPALRDVRTLRVGIRMD